MKPDKSGAFNDGYKLKPILPWRLVGLLVICLLALAAKLADAATPTCRVDAACISWMAVTTNTDGTPVAGPVTYRVTRIGGSFNITSSTSFIATPKAKGQQCFVVTAIDVNGAESAPTPQVCKVLKLAAPSNGRIEAPSNGAITPKP